MLIRNAEIWRHGIADLRIVGERIGEIGQQLDPLAGEAIIEAGGNALLPGLRDHHIHLAATAVARESIPCGPPAVSGSKQLRNALTEKAAGAVGDQWLRGIGYHESVAGDIDANWLDHAVPDQPLRIQHRGGRQWVLNSAALKLLDISSDDPVELEAGKPTGRIYEGDHWLRERLAAIGEGGFPNLSGLGKTLIDRGVVAVTDAGPQNDIAMLQRFKQLRQDGEFPLAVRMMGNDSLNGIAGAGERKFHLLESQLPDLDTVIRTIQQSHEAGRNVAFHCVTRTELVFALAAIDAAGAQPGDRIEHASVTPPEQLEEIRRLGLVVVTQPALVLERGDRYLADVGGEDIPWLYRLEAFKSKGIPLAGSSDAPYTDPDPWVAMQAAVCRQTISGQALGMAEQLTPEAALELYTGNLATAGEPVVIKPGAVADICLADNPWEKLAKSLSDPECDIREKLKIESTWLRGKRLH